MAKSPETPHSAEAQANDKEEAFCRFACEHASSRRTAALLHAASLLSASLLGGQLAAFFSFCENTERNRKNKPTSWLHRRRVHG